MAKTSELVAVTSDDVAQAWQDVENAKVAVEALRHRFVTGDDSVTQAEIASQQGVAEWLELVAHRTENQRERYEVAYAVQARKDLKAEILRDATASGAELAALLDSTYEAACAFTDKADAHDLAVRQWGERAKALGIPDRGLISGEHENLGIESGGTLLIDAARVRLIGAKDVLGLVLQPAFNGGILPIRSDENVATAHRILSRLGKASV